jgi:hypothetical protein
MTRARVIAVGIAVFLLGLYLGTDWLIARDLLDRGYSQSGPYWRPARGMGLSWGAAFAGPGVVAYIGIIVWAALREPTISATRLAVMQLFATALTLLALSVFGAFGVLLGAPVAAGLCYCLLRGDARILTRRQYNDR